MRPGPRNLITDVAGMRVGNAHDVTLRSGSTVLLGDVPFVAGVHVMGGAPGTRETDLLAPDKLVQEVDALVLSGGPSGLMRHQVWRTGCALRDEGSRSANNGFRSCLLRSCSIC